MLTITINEKQYQVAPGQTVLDACRANGAYIPTLCNDPRLNPFGSCLICRVEIEGQRGTPLACGTYVSDGMVIRTDSKQIAEARKTCLELLTSQHYGDCTAPCEIECPAHMDVQGYIKLIAEGKFDEAVRLMKETNPLPVVCGRICTRPCEKKCRRNSLEGPLGIAYLKRYASDKDLAKKQPYLPEKKTATGKKAAIIGAGPAGLSAAWFLAELGHEVTIFDRQEAGGGMLRYGIPSYRMPRETLDAEIDIIKSLGVTIQYDVHFGSDITVDSLKADGYDSILLAVGSQLGWPLGLDGEENCSNVQIGVDFLGSVTRGTQVNLTGKKVAVVGGGNTAMDCARTSVRLGANVDIIYRRTIAEMPADDMEIEEAELEHVRFHILTNPTAVEQKGDTVHLEVTKMELGEPDASGRRRPQAIAGSEYVVEYDYVISAIGQTQDLSFIGSDCNIAIHRDLMVTDTHSMATNIAGIFAAGDAVSGPQTAILAIAGGKKAAIAMDKYMCGEVFTPEPELYNHLRAKTNDEIDPANWGDCEKIEKTPMPMLTEKQRALNFDEVELGFSDEEAKKEASRCLACSCADAKECKLREYATDYNADQFALAGEQSLYDIDKSHTFIVRDRNKCITCGRCVQICTEAGAGTLGFVGRGFDVTIEPAFHRPFGEDKSCINCGLCVSTCPTGALVPRDDITLPTTAYTDLEDVKITEIKDAVEQAKK
ncbi:MAG: FAD-dependent oxidoreductase [Lachnospiraceae bacterium]|nr:FAD-dependent oxidoreductase [Lachnospiraceae bacterium]